MRTLTIKIPDTVNLDDKEAKMMLASKLYEKGTLTLGQAADMVGYSKQTFMKLLNDYGVALINYPSKELDEDVKNARKHSI